MATTILTIFKTPSLRWAGGAHENEIETYLVRFLVRQQKCRVRSHRKSLKYWWRTQLLSNLSQHPNSLLTGKITGNFSISGLVGRSSDLIAP